MRLSTVLYIQNANIILFKATRIVVNVKTAAVALINYRINYSSCTDGPTNRSAFLNASKLANCLQLVEAVVGEDHGMC